MAGYTGSGGRKSRRFADNLNLVPFIDLFTALTIFLISTAVWDQLSSLQVALGADGKGEVAAPEELVKKVESSVKITVAADSITLFDEGKTQQLPLEGSAFDVKALGAFLDGVRAREADRADIVIEARDDARYENLVAVMDESLGRKFSDLIVVGAAESAGAEGKAR